MKVCARDGTLRIHVFIKDHHGGDNGIQPIEGSFRQKRKGLKASTDPPFRILLAATRVVWIHPNFEGVLSNHKACRRPPQKLQFPPSCTHGPTMGWMVALRESGSPEQFDDEKV